MPRATTGAPSSSNFPFTTKAREKKDLENHGVNTGMGLKYGGVRYRLTGDAKDQGSVFRMLDLLDRYHGQATGIFTCDEHLAGRSPSQGTELCTVVEAMYSLEVAAGILADPRLGDRLEQLAFNALPATFTKDMTAHQYDQQCNQVICSAKGEHVYTSNGPEANLYGLEPNFGCCTANMHQGWPKFVSHLWMKTDDGGLAAIAYAPCVIETKIQGKPVKVTVETSYPFREEIAIKVTVAEPMTFPLHLRIPGWADRYELRLPTRSADEEAVGRGGTISGQRRYPAQSWKYIPLSLSWSGTKTLILRLPLSVRLFQGDNNAVAIERGPLVYALPVDTEWKKLRDRPNLPFDDWEVYPKSPWNYALRLDRDHPEQSVMFKERAVRQGTLLSQGSTDGCQGEGPSCRRLGSGKGSRGPASVQSGRQRGTAGGTDTGSLWLHRPAGDRVPNAAFSMR